MSDSASRERVECEGRGEHVVADLVREVGEEPIAVSLVDSGPDDEHDRDRRDRRLEQARARRGPATRPRAPR